MSTWKVRRFVVLCVMVTGAIVAGRAQTAKPVNEALTVNGDGAQRSKDIHWPDGFHPEQADLFAHNEIVIHASCEKVFANIADAQEWPSWYPNSHNVKVLNSPDGKLRKEARFSWDTFGLHIESRVHEFVPGSRIGWFGDGTGLNAYHTFLLLKTDDGCHIVTEEVAKGPGQSTSARSSLTLCTRDMISGSAPSSNALRISPRTGSVAQIIRIAI